VSRLQARVPVGGYLAQAPGAPGPATVTDARNNKDHLSIRPDLPGPALMELLYRTVKPEHYRAAFRGNGDLVVEISSLDALIRIPSNRLGKVACLTADVKV
jgi:hypothetical protein